jgi:hypothetical protein
MPYERRRPTHSMTRTGAPTARQPAAPYRGPSAQPVGGADALRLQPAHAGREPPGAASGRRLDLPGAQGLCGASPPAGASRPARRQAGAARAPVVGRRRRAGRGGPLRLDGAAGGGRQRAPAADHSNGPRTRLSVRGTGRDASAARAAETRPSPRASGVESPCRTGAGGIARGPCSRLEAGDRSLRRAPAAADRPSTSMPNGRSSSAWPACLATWCDPTAARFSIWGATASA